MVRPAAGGIRTHVRTLLTGLDAARFTQTVFAPPDFQLDLPDANFDLIPLDIRARPNPLADWRAIQTLRRRLRGNFAIVHAHGLRAAWIGMEAARRTDTSCLFTAHNLVPPLSPFARVFFARTVRNANRMLAVSQAVADSLIANGADAAKIRVVHNGVDVTPFDVPADTSAIRAQYGILPNTPLILAVGRLAPEKGFDVLLNAFARLRKEMPNARLLLAGDGPLRETLTTRAAALGDSVLLPGRIENVVPLYKIAEVVVIPSRSEGQGLVALEAMAARKPVIASCVGGLPEGVVEGETGWLVPPNDSPALDAAIREALDAPQERLRRGEAGRLRVERAFSQRAMLEQITAIYQELAGKRR